MGWTSTEKLFILFEDGKYVVFSNTGEILSQNKIFTESLSDIVLSANSSDDGFVAFTKNNKVSVPLRAVTRRIYVDCSGETPLRLSIPNCPSSRAIASSAPACSRRATTSPERWSSSCPAWIRACTSSPRIPSRKSTLP